MSHKKLFLLKFASVIIGVSFPLMLLELYARFLPARNNFSIELPLECNENTNNNELIISKNCIFRRKPRVKRRYTAGIFPPLHINVAKRTNDIGQFSNSNFSNLNDQAGYKNRFLTIGDSYVEALQVDNGKSFHEIIGENKEYFSTSIGASGNAFPQYLVHLMYANKRIDLDKVTVLIPIISNDFHKSFATYSSTLAGAYFNEDPEAYPIVFYPLTNNIKTSFRRLLLNNLALARYLLFNVGVYRAFHNYPICLITGLNCYNSINVSANVIEVSQEENPKKYRYGFFATDIFLNEVNKLRPSKKNKENTVFIVDSDRQSIYNPGISKSEFFDRQRNYFIKQALSMGFTVLDLDPVFRKRFAKSAIKFNFDHDNHWNAYGHSVVAEEVLKLNSRISIN